MRIHTEPPSASPTPALEAADEATETDKNNLLAIVSHPIKGNENCVACHATESEIDPAPFDHAIYTNETCQECHPPAAD